MGTKWVVAGDVAAARQRWNTARIRLREVQEDQVLALGAEPDSNVLVRIERARSDEAAGRADYDDALREFQEFQRFSEVRFSKFMAWGQLALALGMAVLGYMQLKAAQAQGTPPASTAPRCK